MASRPFKVLLAIEERASLRHCARLLSVFGYEVRGTASLTQAAQLLSAYEPDMLIVASAADLEPALALCREAGTRQSAHYLYKVLLVPQMPAGELLRAIEAGVDDLVALPAENGELLARLRTAVRVIEFERRASEHATRDETTGLLRKEAFLARLEAELTADPRGEQDLACVVAQVDGYDELQSLTGRPGAEALLRELVLCLRKKCEPRQVQGLLDGQRFAALVAKGPEEALAWAEALRTSIADREFSLGGGSQSLSISCGVAVAARPTEAAELLQKAQRALELAQQSGGNYVAGYEEFVAEAQRWSELAAAGRLLENAVIRNIMVPCTLLLRTQDTIRQVEAIFGQTQLRALPVVDDEGKLAGLVTASAAHASSNARDAAQQPVRTIMNKDIASFDEHTTLAAVIDYFSLEAPPVIVIVNKGRPTGLVTPNSLATLVERLTTDTFVPKGEAQGSASLRVSNLCGVDGGWHSPA